MIVGQNWRGSTASSRDDHRTDAIKVGFDESNRDASHSPRREMSVLFGKRLRPRRRAPAGAAETRTPAADFGGVERGADRGAIVDQDVGPLPDFAGLVEWRQRQPRLIGQPLGIEFVALLGCGEPLFDLVELLQRHGRLEIVNLKL